MERAKPITYDRVHVYNFLPPGELDEVLGLFRTVTGKLVAINRTLGIEAPVLTANDDFAAMDFYQNLGESQMSVSEKLRLKAHALAQQHPEEWAATIHFPNRVYSGKTASKNSSPPPDLPEAPLPSTLYPLPCTKNIFLAYRIPTSDEHNVTTATATSDVRWYMINRDSGEITEDLAAIHEAISCTEKTPRTIRTDREERDTLRKKVEKKEVDKVLFRSGIPMGLKEELICWMEIG